MSPEQTGPELEIQPASPGYRHVAIALTLLSVAVLIAVVPIVGQQWIAAPAFIPAYQAAAAICDLVTAALLFGQFRELGRRSLLLLGGGYLYTASLIVAHTLSFPGLFGPTSLIGGAETTVWLWLAWHVPLPLLVMGGAFWGEPVHHRLNAGDRALTTAVLLPLGLASAAILLATVGHDRLPILLDENRYIPGVTRPALSVPLILVLLALATLVARTRLRSGLDLWLAVALGASVVEILLSAVLNTGRFQAGFYIGRLYGLLASCVLMISLLLETGAVHGRLARALARERDAARAELGETATRYRRLFESMDSGFCIIEVSFDAQQTPVDYRFIEVNPAFEWQTGLADATGAWMREIAPEHEQHWFDLYGRVALTGEPCRFENHAAALDRWYDVHAFRVGAPEARRVAILFNDISLRRQTERALAESEAELRRVNEDLEARVREEVTARETVQAQLAHAQRMEAVGHLAGGVAHDFNNVLQAVQGGARLIEGRPGDAARVRRLALMIAEAAGRGAAITRRLLAFSRRADLRVEDVDAAALLADMREILAHTLGAGVTVRVESAPGLPPLLADKRQLETVLINLAANARDAIGGTGTITLSAAADQRPQGHGSEAGSYLMLSVADDGSGMDTATLARAGEPFFTTKASGKGTGLGLAMAKGFAAQSGGGLAIESAPGAGTTVRLWLPMSQQGGPSDAPLSDQPFAAQGVCRVLLVDDDPIVREIMAKGLATAGCAVQAAGSGQEALALLDAGEAADILVSDLSMPVMDGLCLIREAQRRRPGMPAILLTGFATDEADPAMSSALSGRVSLLRKPVEASALADRVAALLEAKAQPAGSGA